ncbi:uncharacterized protein LOC114293747 [Camellia sinensis]|uniref:uncharacterized protein LOC114293747 n=1 Tax=Camellia sinensis TaxID=4442 RepID=UPI001036CD48|nr:uncharacterized protein LOC114293747 [Camellia sinensis]
MSVAEFEAAFSSLSRFALELVATEEHRCYEFEQRLRKILFKVAGNMIQDYDRLVEAAAHVEIIVEAEEERLRNSRSRGQGSQGDFRPNKRSKSTFSSQSQSQQSRSTFPLPSAGPKKSAPNMGASHSFISAAFVSALGLEVIQLASPLRVESPVGGAAELDRGCHGCEIEVAERRLPFSFVLIDMSSFDVILGMDWLSSYWAVIDCFRQKVTVCTSSGDCFYFLGDRVDRVLSPIFDSHGRNELSGVLVTFLDDESSGTRVELPRVVYEYPDVGPY